MQNAERRMENQEILRAVFLTLNSAFCVLNSYNYVMSEVAKQSSSRRPRLLWTLLGAMVLVGLLPLAVSHYFLIGINRDSLETLEKKYLSRAAISIATDVQDAIASNTQQLNTIAGIVVVMKRALPPDTDAFGYMARRQAITSYISSDSDLLALRILNSAGAGSEATPAGLEQAVLQEMDFARIAA